MSVHDWRVTLKPWADRRLWFIQARCGGRVVWGVVYDAGDTQEIDPLPTAAPERREGRRLARTLQRSVLDQRGTLTARNPD